MEIQITRCSLAGAYVTIDNVNYQIDNTVKISEAYHNFGGINFKNGKLSLHLFLKYPKEDLIEDYILNCDWEKPYEQEQEKEHQRRMFIKYTYFAAPTDFRLDFNIK